MYMVCKGYAKKLHERSMMHNNPVAYSHQLYWCSETEPDTLYNHLLIWTSMIADTGGKIIMLSHDSLN